MPSSIWPLIAGALLIAFLAMAAFHVHYARVMTSGIKKAIAILQRPSDEEMLDA